MYCCKCGKEIPSGTLCPECAAQNQAQYVPPYTPPYTPHVRQAPDYSYINGQPNWMPEPNNRMFGFGKALASTIMSSIGFVFAYIGLFLMIWEDEAAAAFILLSIPLVIIPLVFGISSIKLFSSRKNFCAKPVATLVLGIVGVATAAVAAIFSFFDLMILMAFA